MADLPTRPWRIVDTGSAYRVNDAEGRPIAYVYYKRDPALWTEYMRPDEARAFAQRIARISREEPSS